MFCGLQVSKKIKIFNEVLYIKKKERYQFHMLNGSHKFFSFISHLFLSFFLSDINRLTRFFFLQATYISLTQASNPMTPPSIHPSSNPPDHPKYCMVQVLNCSPSPSVSLS